MASQRQPRGTNTAPPPVTMLIRIDRLITSATYTRALYWLRKARYYEAVADRADRLGVIQAQGSANPARGRARQQGHTMFAAEARKLRDRCLSQAEAVERAEAHQLDALLAAQSMAQNAA